VPAVPLLLCPLFLFSFLFFPAFSVLVMKRWGRCWLLLSNLGLGSVLCLSWCSFIPHSLYPLSLVFSCSPLSVFFLFLSSPVLCVFFLSVPLFFSCPSQPLVLWVPPSVLSLSLLSFFLSSSVAHSFFLFFCSPREVAFTRVFIGLGDRSAL
jgi:hypothetical protein